MKKLFLLVAMVSLVTTGYGVDSWSYSQTHSRAERNEYVTQDNLVTEVYLNPLEFGIMNNGCYGGNFRNPVASNVTVILEITTINDVTEQINCYFAAGSITANTGVKCDVLYHKSWAVVDIFPSSDNTYQYWPQRWL